MNTISKTHQLFSGRLNVPRVLENPEEFLGPNYKEVLNFWLILDELSEEQWRVVKERDVALYRENTSQWYKTRDLAVVTSEEVVGWRYSYVSGRSVYDDTKSEAAGWATRELIGMHLILEQQSLTFFEMFLEVL